MFRPFCDIHTEITEITEKADAAFNDIYEKKLGWRFAGSFLLSNFAGWTLLIKCLPFKIQQLG